MVVNSSLISQESYVNALVLFGAGVFEYGSKLLGVIDCLLIWHLLLVLNEIDLIADNRQY